MYIVHYQLLLQPPHVLLTVYTNTTPTHSGDQQVAEEAQKTLTEFVQSLMDSCLETVMERLKNEATHQESVALIRALDKVSGKLQAMDNLLPSVNFSE